MCFRIAICDDNIESCYKLRDEIIQYNEQVHKGAEFYLFQSGKAVLKSIFENSMKMDVLFLDIEMPELDGFEVAKLVKEQKPNLILIFVTSHDERVFEALDFRPFHYIRKSQIQSALPRVLEDAYEVVEAIDDKALVIKEGERRILIKPDDIFYCEVQKRKLAVYLTDMRVLFINKTMQEFWVELNSKNFVKLSRGCCVNINHISEITSHYVTLKNGKRLVGSVAMIKEAKKQVVKYWRMYE